MSAAPSATRPNLTADPSICLTAPGLLSIKASVLASPCERLTATVQGPPGGGRRRVWIAFAPKNPQQKYLSTGGPPLPFSRPSGPPAEEPPPYQSERGCADDAQ